MTYSAPLMAKNMPNRRFKQLAYVQVGDIPCTTGPAIGYVCVLDTGTTGTDLAHDCVTTLGWMVLGVNAHYQICEVHGPWLHAGPWPTQDNHHHLTSALQMFVGHLNRCSLVIAHNALFDEAMLRKALPQLPSHEQLPWACSMRDTEWRALGIRDIRLKDLLEWTGMCHNAHNTVDDVVALSWVLSRNMPGAKRLPAVDQTVKMPKAAGGIVHVQPAAPERYPSVLQALIEWTEASKIVISVAANTADQRRALKTRGYRFDKGVKSCSPRTLDLVSNRRAPRQHWTRLLPHSHADAEYRWLTSNGHKDVGLDAVFGRSLFSRAQEPCSTVRRQSTLMRLH